MSPFTDVGKCTCDSPTTQVCKKPFYDAFDLCLVCSHARACHEDAAKAIRGLGTQEFEDE